MYGRFVALEPPSTCILQNQGGTHRVNAAAGTAQPGDWVELRDGSLQVPPPTRAGPSRWMKRPLAPRRVRAVNIRPKVEAATRDFSRLRDFRETRTPLLVP